MGGLSCVVVGDAAIALRCAEILRGRGHRVLGVVTGDGRIAGWCAGRQIPCRFAGPETPLGREEVLALTGGAGFDLLFSLHNLRIFPAGLLALPRRMAINYHDALLPRYGGLHATTWALFQGEAVHGITWHRMIPEVDGGEILAQREVAIPPDADAWALNVACTEAALASFPELLAGLETGALVPRPQSAAGRSWFPGWRKPAPGCVIPWDAPAEAVSAFVRCLDFGAADNPLGVPKLLAPGGVLRVRSLEILDRRSGEPAGTMLAAGPAGIVVATATRDVRLPWDAQAEGLGLVPGVRLAAAVPEGDRFASRERALRRHEGFWTAALEDLSPLAPPGFPADGGDGDQESLASRLPAETLDRLAALGPLDGVLLGAMLAWLGLEVGEPFDVALGEPALRGEIVRSGWDGLLAARPPLRVAAIGEQSFRTYLETLNGERERRRARDTYPLDLPARVRRLRSRPETAPAVIVDLLAAGEEPPGLDPGTALAVAISPDGRLTWRARPGDPGRLAGFVARFAGWLAALAEDPDRGPNDGPAARPATVDERFREQAARAPDAVAIDADGEVWTYGRLAARASRLAAALRRRGVGPERLVALRVERLADLVTCLLGVLEAGGAFLVLDPREPPARLARLLAAARPWLALAGSGEASGLPRISSDLPVHPLALADAPEGPAPGPCAPGPGSRLAYVAFTSGSTGAPKGVAVEHPALARYIAAGGRDSGSRPATACCSSARRPSISPTSRSSAPSATAPPWWASAAGFPRLRSCWRRARGGGSPSSTCRPPSGRRWPGTSRSAGSPSPRASGWW